MQYQLMTPTSTLSLPFSQNLYTLRAESMTPANQDYSNDPMLSYDTPFICGSVAKHCHGNALEALSPPGLRVGDKKCHVV